MMHRIDLTTGCRALLLLVGVAMLGCVWFVTGPSESIEFDEVNELTRLVGYYRNRGDAGPDVEEDILLSRMIWTETEMDHSAIEFIGVLLEGPDSLRVEAIAQGEVVHSDVFVRGEDFVMSGNRINLGKEAGAELFEVAFGLYSQRGSLGFESSGDAIYRSSASDSVLLGLIIPVGVLVRQDVRFQYATTLDALMSEAGGATKAESDAIAPVRNSELEREILHYIAAFEGVNWPAREQALLDLAWSGISDTRIYDPMEAELLRRYRTKKGSTAKNLSHLIKGLSLSGQSQYRPTLLKLAREGETSTVVSHAEAALPRLEQYARWNPVILASVEDAPEGSLNELRICNMMRAGDPQLRRIGARQAYLNYLRNERVIEVANQSMLREFNRDSDRSGQIDSVLWLMKVVVNSGLSAYVSSFEHIASVARVNKIANTAENYAALLEKQQVGRYVIDIGAGGPTDEPMRLDQRVKVGDVVDARHFTAGLQSSSAPSTRQASRLVPPEKRAALIGVTPHIWWQHLVLRSLPVGSSVQGEVRELLQTGLNRHHWRDSRGEVPLILHATIDEFWCWLRKGVGEATMEARISVRLKIEGSADETEFTVQGSGSNKVALATEAAWMAVYEVAYRDFLVNLEKALVHTGI